MQVVILAAGLGTRLGSDKPKPLAQLAPGVTLLSNQVAILGRLVQPEQPTVVVGHGADAIIKAHPTLRFVHNPRFARTNTAASLLEALCVLDDDDVLWVNGDLYFEPDAAQVLLSRAAERSAALVNRRAMGSEPVKYSLHSDGSIAGLSKSLEQPRGESLGMHIVTRHDRPALRAALEQAADQDYFEAALESCTRAGAIRMMPVDVGAAYAREIDFPHDLTAVRAHLAARAKGAGNGQ